MRIRENCSKISTVSMHNISIGGSLRVLWRSPPFRRTAVMRIRNEYANEPGIDPQLYASNNGMMATFIAVMRHWLETYRRRGSDEKLCVYLAAAWRQGLEAMGIRPEWGQQAVTVTPKALTHSPAMKKMKKDLRGSQ